jgi:hypothetical protein
MHWVWVALLLLAGTFYWWWERPAKSGTATLYISAVVQGAPEGSKGALWTGPTGRFPGPWDPGESWRPFRGEGLAFAPLPLPLAPRRFRQGVLLRKTHDLAVLQLQAPDGSRRYVVYDLRDDMMSGLLKMGRPLYLQFSCRWASLKPEPFIPKDKDRQNVGF